jgi:ribonuclease VapC
MICGDEDASVVLDTSALLAVFFAERHGPWVLERMAEHDGTLKMSTVNLAETLIRIRDRQPASHQAIERKLLSGSITFVPPTADHARLAAEARMRFPLNLGDCFAYALATAENEPLLTLDADFERSDVTVISP